VVQNWKLVKISQTIQPKAKTKTCGVARNTLLESFLFCISKGMYVEPSRGSPLLVAQSKSDISMICFRVR
jgi:hypothetical protein